MNVIFVGRKSGRVKQFDLRHPVIMSAAALLVLAIVGTALSASYGRRMTEIELPIVQIRHAGQALTKRIQPYDIRIHLPNAHRQGIHFLLQNALGVFDLCLLVQQLSRPITQLIYGVTAAVTGTQTYADGECRAHNGEHQQHRRRHNHRMSQVKLFHSARLAADKNDIHTDLFFQSRGDA